MVDIHNHTLFGVDDGPEHIELSLEMIRYASEQGVSSLVLTPHYRKGMFRYDKDLIQTNFELLKSRCSEEHVDIKLFLGCEYHVNDRILEYMSTGRTLALANSDYLLTEYSYDVDIKEIVYMTNRMISCSYIPVIAHVERYRCIQKKPKLCSLLKDLGALIQCNAGSILGMEGRITEKTTAKLLKNRWVDIVASDTHDMGNRKSHLLPAYEYVSRKYGADYSKNLFSSTPSKIVESFDSQE